MDQRLGQGAVIVLTVMLINKGRRENMEQGRVVITKEQRKQNLSAEGGGEAGEGGDGEGGGGGPVIAEVVSLYRLC